MLMKTGLVVRLRLLNFALRGVSSMMGSNWHEGQEGRCEVQQLWGRNL